MRERGDGKEEEEATTNTVVLCIFLYQTETAQTTIRLARITDESLTSSLSRGIVNVIKPLQ